MQEGKAQDGSGSGKTRPSALNTCGATSPVLGATEAGGSSQASSTLKVFFMPWQEDCIFTNSSRLRTSRIEPQGGTGNSGGQEEKELMMTEAERNE